MKLLRDQHGFHALEIALFVIVAGLVGGTGVYVAQRQPSEVTQEAVAETTTVSEPVAKAPNAEQRYLIIGEWGVRMPLDDDIAGATYLIDGPTAYLGLSTLGEFCQPAAGGGMASITRLDDKAVNSATNKPYKADGESVITIDGRLYSYVRGQAACSNPPNEEAEMTALTSFFKAFKTLQPAQ